MRFDHVYEVDPGRMKVFKQQDMPAWDTMRIVSNRWEHLHWMHSHFAEMVISGDDLEKELEEENKARGRRRTAGRKKK